MPLPSTGALDFGSIQTEFGKTNPISLTEYYGYAPGLPASGAISVADFYSKKYKSYWMSTFAGSGTYTDYGYGIAADSAGNVYIVGTSLNLAVVAKYNSSGVVQWQRSLGSTGTNAGYGIALDSSGNVFVVGHTDAQGAGLIDLILAKYNNSGVIQWQRRLGG